MTPVSQLYVPENIEPDKPASFLWSWLNRLAYDYPEVTVPHRLDLDTSGLMG